MTAPLAIRPVRSGSARFTAARTLLHASGVLTEDIARPQVELFGAAAGAELRGVIGLEIYGPEALLRSLAVGKDHRGAGIGGRLVQFAIATARSRGGQRLVLLTYDAADFFAAHGFYGIERAQIPAALTGTPQLAGLCADTAVAMQLDLTGRPGARQDRASPEGRRTSNA